METVLLQITNNKAYQLLENLEALNIFKILKKDKNTETVKKPSAHDFLGLISKKDIKLMEDAIQQGCEQINPSDWE